jgi:1-acyl-sn-glycerol-3-phosphate acyltransferase
MRLEGTIALARRQSRLLRVMAWTWWVVGCGTLLRRFVRNPDAVEDYWKGVWARRVARVIGLDVRVVVGSAVWKSPRGRLVIANHRSPLDIPALMSLFGGHFLANHRVKNAPIIGVGARAIGTVFVDREDRRSGAAAIRVMRRLLERGRTLIVFPEGTTFGGDEVRPFKGGAFAAASGLDIDVVPVGIAYVPGHEFAGGTTGDHIRGFLARPRTPVWIAIGEPIPFPAQRRGAEEQFRARVQGLVSRARAAAQAEAGAAWLPARSEPPSLPANAQRGQAAGGGGR